MGIKYHFKLARLDLTVHTSQGTNSTIDREILTRDSPDGSWKVVSNQWAEPGNTEHLDAGKVETFKKKFTTPIDLGHSDDAKGFRDRVMVRFRTHGNDAWSPSKIRFDITFLRELNTETGFWDNFVETLFFEGKDVVLSTDPSEGTKTKSFVLPKP